VPVTRTCTWNGYEVDGVFDLIDLTPQEGSSVPLSLAIGFQIGAARAAAPTGGQVTITTPGDGTWTPGFAGTALVECWGAGGSSTTTAVANRAGGGGGGGAYAAWTITIAEGTEAIPRDYHVGAASAATAGADTWFNDPSDVLAKGGNASVTSSAGGLGGAAASCIGDVTRSGGNGGSGSSSHPNNGGGGGSSAGPSSAGNAGTTGNAGGSGAAGAAVTDGGAGGAGGTPGVAGSNGVQPGGGSGGGGSTSGGFSAAGGVGGHGQIRITYTEGATGRGGPARLSLRIGIGF